MRIVLAFFFLSFSSSLLLAQQKSDSLKHTVSATVIVTGFPSDEKTPIPQSQVPKAELKENSPFNDVPSILKQLPSVVSYSQSGLNTGYSNVNIRGFDQRREAVLVNGVPQNDPEDHSVYWVDMPDLASFTSKVDVQRGAGSSFYGSPAIGGSINVETFPSPNRDFTLSAMGGSYNTTKFSASAASGLIDSTYLFSAKLSKFHTDGYRNHDFIDMNSYYLSAVRMDNTSTWQFNFYGGTLNDGLDYYGIFPGENNDRSNFIDPDQRKINYSEPFTYERRPQEQEFFSQPHYELLSSIKLDDNLTLNNTLFYIQGDGYFDFDGTWPNVYDPTVSHSVLYRLTPDYGLRYNFHGILDTTLGNELTRGFVGNKQGGWLPRLEFTHDGGKFTLGGEIRIHRSNHWGQLLSAAKMPLDLPGDYHYYDYDGGKDIFGGYISELYSVSSDVNVQASVQLLSQTYHFGNEQQFYLDTTLAQKYELPVGWHNFTFDVPLFFVNPRIGINLNLSKQVSSYASLSYTSREPRLKDYYNPESFGTPNFARKADGSFDYNSPNIKPEHLTDLELGIRSSELPLSDEWKSSFSLGGYYMPFTDELLKTGKVDIWGSAVLANAEKVDHYGVEVEAGLQYEDVIGIKINATYSHNEIKQFDKYADTISVIGNQPIGFPSILANASLLIQPVKNLQLTIAGRYVGSMYGDLENSDLLKNDAYGVLDASLSYKFDHVLGVDHFTLRAQINNLTNNLYTSYVDGSTGFFVGATRNGYLAIELGL